MKQLHFASCKLHVTRYTLHVTCNIFKSLNFKFLNLILLFCSSALFAQQSDTTTLNLLNPTYPAEFTFTPNGYWDKTFVDEGFTFFKSQIYSFSHLIEGKNSSFGGLAWNGFTVCNSGDNANYTGEDWNNYQWGCMAGGGIKTDAQGNVMTNEAGEVLVQKGLPYLVSYWSYTMEPEWWHLYWFQGIFLDEPTRCLQIRLDNDKEYEAVGVYVNIHPWVYFSNIYGSYPARPLNQEGDFFKLIIHGFNPDGTESGKSVEHFFAKFENGQLIQSTKWEWVDLTSLGEIGGIYCTMATTDNSNLGYGPNTPVMFCMDKLQVRTKETVIHIPVTNIVNVPAVAGVGESLTLTGTVTPINATCQNIIWNIKDAGTTGATIVEDVFLATDTGTVVITATIKDGLDVGSDFTKDFTISVLKEVVKFVITATVNNTDFGTINPSGEVTVEQGGSVTFFITPSDKYEVNDVMVNGYSHGKISTYTFEDVQKDGSIEVVFIKKAGIEENDLTKIQIYSYRNCVYIKNQSVNGNYFVYIFDMTGRLVYQGAIQDVETVIPLNVVQGIYNVLLYCFDVPFYYKTKIFINTP